MVNNVLGLGFDALVMVRSHYRKDIFDMVLFLFLVYVLKNYLVALSKRI